MSAATEAPPGWRPHRAVEFVQDLGDGQYRRECRVCERPVLGFGPTFRHYGEPEPSTQPDPRYAETLEHVRTVLTRAGMTGQEARQTAVALYEAGLLRQRRAAP